MFLRMQTQWDYAGMGDRVGLNYCSLEALFRIFQPRNQRTLFRDIREIETGVLEADAERRERKRKT